MTPAVSQAFSTARRTRSYQEGPLPDAKSGVKRPAVARENHGPVHLEHHVALVKALGMMLRASREAKSPSRQGQMIRGRFRKGIHTVPGEVAV